MTRTYPLSAALIFIAGHNSEERYLIERALRNHGFAAVQSVADGAQAVDQLSRALAGDGLQPLPEAIVLELEMPHHNGLEVLRWITKSTQIIAPVIVHASSKTAFARQQAMDLGAAAFVTKEVEYLPLVKALRELKLQPEYPGGR